MDGTELSVPFFVLSVDGAGFCEQSFLLSVQDLVLSMEDLVSCVQDFVLSVTKLVPSVRREGFGVHYLVPWTDNFILSTQ